jgi:hypothetical protein
MRSFICPLARGTPRRQQTADKAILKHHGNSGLGGPSAALGITELELERDRLFRKIGELEMHRDFLKKSLQKAGL